MCKPEIRKCILRLLGFNMSIVSPCTIALGIADLILVQQWVCSSSSCLPLSTAFALTYAAVAIWAPVPIFFNGIGAIWIAGRPAANNGWLCLLSFFNTIAFAPVIVIVTALGLSYKFPSGAPTAANGGSSNAMAIFGIEVTIAVVGGVLFLHALAVLYLNCCCTNCLHEEMAHVSGANVGVVANDVYVAGRKTVVNTGGQGPYPTQAEINRMNIWSAYR